jgi:hypothetical protein
VQGRRSASGLVVDFSGFEAFRKGGFVMSMLATLAVVVSSVVGQAQPAESNYEHLKEFGQAFGGDWVGDFEFDFDIPGVIKKGDKVTLRFSTKWILDKNALEMTWEADINGAPAGSGKGIAGWDRATKEIVSFGFGTFGGRGQTVHTKVGDRWIEVFNGTSLEGTRIASMSVVTFSNQGNLQVIEETGRMTPGGDPLPNRKYTYKRVKRASE